MKKLLFLSFFAFVLAACSKDDEQPAGTLSVTPERLEFDAKPDAPQTLAVQAENVRWKASSSAEWLTLENVEGTSNGVVRVTARPNGSTEPRNAEIVVSGEGTRPVTVSVVQSALPLALSVETERLVLPAREATERTIAVRAENVRWKASTETEWIELLNDEGEGDGSFVVRVGYNTTAEAQSGKIVVSGEGVGNVEIAVEQLGEAAVIWDRSSLSRMNLWGAVKGVSFFGMYVNNAIVSLGDLKFDEAGMLTAFRRENAQGVTLTYTLAYDDRHRLTDLECGENGLHIEYGTHGQYINTDNLFNNIGLLLNADYNIWLPRFIKDLGTIDVRTTNRAGETVTDRFVVRATQSAGSILWNDEELETFTLENGFTATNRFDYWGTIDGTFTVNPLNGNLLQHTQSIEEQPILNILYNDDFINTVAEVYGEPSSQMTYNDHLDVDSVTDADNGRISRMSYDYDERNNWVKMDISGYAGNTILRTITY